MNKHILFVLAFLICFVLSCKKDAIEPPSKQENTKSPSSALTLDLAKATFYQRNVSVSTRNIDGSSIDKNAFGSRVLPLWDMAAQTQFAGVMDVLTVPVFTSEESQDALGSRTVLYFYLDSTSQITYKVITTIPERNYFNAKMHTASTEDFTGFLYIQEGDGSVVGPSMVINNGLIIGWITEEDIVQATEASEGGDCWPPNWWPSGDPCPSAAGGNNGSIWDWGIWPWNWNLGGSNNNNSNGGNSNNGGTGGDNSTVWLGFSNSYYYQWFFFGSGSTTTGSGGGGSTDSNLFNNYYNNNLFNFSQFPHFTQTLYKSAANGFIIHFGLDMTPQELIGLIGFDCFTIEGDDPEFSGNVTLNQSCALSQLLSFFVPSQIGYFIDNPSQLAPVLSFLENHPNDELAVAFVDFILDEVSNNLDLGDVSDYLADYDINLVYLEAETSEESEIQNGIDILETYLPADPQTPSGTPFGGSTINPNGGPDLIGRTNGEFEYPCLVQPAFSYCSNRHSRI